MQCPTCGIAMTTLTMEGHQGRTIDIDLCGACQVLWFDGYESLQLTPGATLRLFRTIGERGARGGTPAPQHARCPRCRALLASTHDMQRNVGFHYWRCPSRHGRLITFFDFLREKNFIRPLSGDQVEALRRSVQSVNCSNCGGPVDLSRGAACGHCGTPLSMLDLHQAETLIAQLQAADQADKPIDPTLPMRLEQARREVDAAFARHREGTWAASDLGGDLVTAGLGALARWLGSRG